MGWGGNIVTLYIFKLTLWIVHPSYGYNIFIKSKNILLINHTFDNRTELNVKTHSNQKEKALKLDKLLPILNTEDFNNADVLGIDEAQFFPDLLEFIKQSEKFNKIIIVVGLDGDYKREKIGQILDIIPYCDTVVKLAAMDMIDKDGSRGIFSKRIVENNEKILIGAKDTYLAVSRKNDFEIYWPLNTTLFKYVMSNELFQFSRPSQKIWTLCLCLSRSL